MTKKRTKRRPKPRPKRRAKSPFRKKMDKQRDLLLQRIGAVSIFLLVFGLLMGALIVRWVFHGDGPIFDPTHSQQQEFRQQFVQEIIPTAQRLQRQYGILASVSMAQAMLESEFGQSELAASYHNLFGVKTDQSDPDGVDFATLEYFDDEWIEITDRFKVYPDWDASMTAHAELIYYGTSWDQDFYQSVIDGDTYEAQAEALQTSGYATDPDYSAKLVSMIEEWDLAQYDQPLNESS